MLDVMIDLESMGTRTDSAVVAIGACEFDMDRDAIGALFYATADLSDAVGHGLKMDAGTVKWWLQQGDKSRQEIARPQFRLPVALGLFADWLHERGPREEVRVWGNGPSFDNAMLSHSYAACGIELPWRFRNDRCVRTLCAMYPSIAADAREGVHHNALDDAIFQAQYLCKIKRVLRERRAPKVAA